MKILESSDFSRLFKALKEREYSVIGPTVRDGAIVYDEIHIAKDLPIGWRDEQTNGRYQLHNHHDGAFFNYAAGPDSWKKILHVSGQRLWKGTKNGHDFTIEPEVVEERKLAFLGVRPCELHAIAIQDKIFLQGPYMNTFYAARRKNVLLIAVNCLQPAATCFCASLNTGPKASGEFDIALTEVMDGQHYFAMESGTEQGAEILNEVSQTDATELQQKQVSALTERALQKMQRSLDTHELRELLYRNYNNPRWDQVAERCMNCANCTMVCPTCFCTTTEDVTDLSGAHAERWQKWDSCFHLQFSYIHGGVVRTSPKSRYRQWMMHKLATWKDQFGTFGCVGCGRCITWCPAGIDLTAESAAIRQSEKQGATK
jgi:formate hydrogenlyase subunit 6/NADH:ubiquinone oxidoreductase subunit I